MSGLYLASGLPRRHELLDQVGIAHTVVASAYEESNEVISSPVDMVEAQALGKAKAAIGVPDGSIVLGADTIVVHNGEILGKPATKEDARRMLHALSGDTHSVITGVAIVIGNQEWVFHNETFVHFKTLSIHEIESYIDTGEPMDKAGAYGIQGKGALWVTGIEGSYTNVVGLPVEQVYDTLRQIFG